MIITLSDGTTTLTLPPALQWVNEFNWSPVAQQRSYTVTGAMWLHSQALAAGRPIELQAEPTQAWMLRSQALALYAWAAQAGLELVLTIDGTPYDVVFDQESKALDARPVMPWADPVGTDHLISTLRFITI